MNTGLPLTVRPMQEDDLAAVCRIECSSFRDPWSLDSFRTELEFNRLAFYFSACLKGKVIGYIGAWLVLDELHITTLAVDASWRRLGVASYLLAGLVKRARRRGARIATLEVRPSNTPARRFYENCGFKLCGRRKNYYRAEDALVMTAPDLSHLEQAVMEKTAPPGEDAEEGKHPG